MRLALFKIVRESAGNQKILFSEKAGQARPFPFSDFGQIEQRDSGILLGRL
jgi:hypothetical protein